ncbi:MAG: hypothetical protein ACKOQ7_10250, partial [Actinomycetota bacterium]
MPAARAASTVDCASVTRTVTVSKKTAASSAAPDVSIATRIHILAARAASAIEASGATLDAAVFFDTVTVRVTDAQSTVEAARAAGINIRRIDAGR